MSEIDTTGQADTSELDSTEKMYKASFGIMISIHTLLFVRAGFTAKNIFWKEYTPTFFKYEVACILVVTLVRVTCALISFAQADILLPFHATLSMISYYVNDLALFLYAFRIWIASSDADKRSKNLYIERYSDLTEREKLAALEPSTIDLPRARFMKYFYMTSQAVVIITFNVVAVSTASIYNMVDHPEVDDTHNEHLQVLYWVDNIDLIWWFSISMLVYRTVIIVFLIVAIWNFLLVEVQTTNHSTEGL